jgi:sterol desaturase/sphingolipid hydroxylase (fatty acid hydroxylase superfamily)
MGELTSLFLDVISYQLNEALQLVFLTATGVLTAILFTRDSLQIVLKRLAPSSLRVNLIVYVVDALIVSLPIGFLVIALYKHLGTAKMVMPMLAVPDWVLATTCLFVGDFIGYWRHRLEHSRLLWSAHSLHHSDEQMTWFTAYRIHPLNRLITAVIDTCALLIIGFPVWAIAIAAVVRRLYGMFVHMDRPWTLGILSWILVSPAMHRWHHVRAGRGMHSNYGQVFSTFDRMLGTYYVPGPCSERLGVEGINHTEYVSQMLLPLQGLFKKLRVDVFNRSSFQKR